MWHQLWFVVPTLISFDMFVTSITWQHVPGPPASQMCNTESWVWPGEEAIELPQTCYKQMLNPPAPTVSIGLKLNLSNLFNIYFPV